MSRTDHHRRGHGRYAPSRFWNDANSAHGEYRWRGMRQAKRDEQQPARKEITAQIQALLVEDAPMTPSILDSVEPAATRECQDLDELDVFEIHDERLRTADLADLMGSESVPFVGRRRRGPIRWDATKCERQRVWEVARSLHLSSKGAVRLLRVGLNEYVSGPQATIPMPVIRELTALVETRRDECERLLADIPGAWEPTAPTAWAVARAVEERRLRELRERLGVRS